MRSENSVPPEIPSEIKKEIKKYKKIFAPLSPEIQKLAEDLYTQAAHMHYTLNKLNRTILEEGAIITATNGNGFEVTTEHPAQTAAIKLVKNYNAAIKTLSTLLHKAAPREVVDELEQFLSGGG